MTTTAVSDRPGARALAAEVLSLIATAVARTLLGVVVTLLLWSVLPTLFGWSSDVVVSGSMQPRIAPGDVIASQPLPASAVPIGRVVLVDNPARPGTLLMHRVVARNPDGTLRTRGDANSVDDSTPVPASMVRGLPRLRIRFVGLPMMWLQHGQYGMLALTILVLCGSAVVSTRRPPPAPATQLPAGAAP